MAIHIFKSKYATLIKRLDAIRTCKIFETDDADWDDECVINFNAKSELIESIRDWVSIKEIK